MQRAFNSKQLNSKTTGNNGNFASSESRTGSLCSRSLTHRDKEHSLFTFFFVQNRRLTKRLTPPPGFWKNLFSISSTPRKRSYGQFSSLTLNIPGLVKNNLITFYGERGKNCEDEMGVPRNPARWKNLFRALRPCHPSKNKDTFNINR